MTMLLSIPDAFLSPVATPDLVGIKRAGRARSTTRARKSSGGTDWRLEEVGPGAAEVHPKHANERAAMRHHIELENIEDMRREAGIDDVELREEIRGLRVGDSVRLTA